MLNDILSQFQILKCINERQIYLVQRNNTRYLLKHMKHDELSILLYLQDKSVSYIPKVVESYPEGYALLYYIDGQDFIDYINGLGRGLYEDEARSIFYQMALRLKTLHDLNIIHHDLKLENFIIDPSNQIHLIDYGYACHLPDCHLIRCGTLQYIAPEKITGNISYLFRSDIYSLGICFYALLTGIFPFDSFSDQILYAEARKIHSPLGDLIDRMIQKQPEDRPGLDEIIQKLIPPF